MLTLRSVGVLKAPAERRYLGQTDGRDDRHGRDSRDAGERRLKLYLRSAGDALVPRTPRAGIESMIAFYNGVRFEDVDLESDGDMLLFQWGTYDWGNGAMFEIDMTRQLIATNGEDDDIWQLHLTYRFAPSEALGALGKGNRWCARPDATAPFELFVLDHPALAAVGSRTDGQSELAYESTG